MSSISANSKPGGTPSSNPTNSKQTTPAFNGAPSNGFPDNTARRLGRLGRTSTPDSEALASSDDESEARTAGLDSRSPFASTNLSSLTSAATSVLAAAPATKTRRMSWLTETSSPIHTLPRKNSFAGPLTMSPTGSNPNTPSLDSTWGAHPASAGLPRVGSLPWSNEIWNSASTNTVADRRESISRRGEHLTSPSSAVPLTASSATFFNDPASVSQLSPATNVAPQSQFPFSIPLHPTPKTYRSQSYSVGQLDSDILPGISAGVIGGRSRLPHSGIPHRASRPSMLGDLSEVGLGKLKEDDNEEDIDPMQRIPQTVVPLYQSAEASKIEKLERENAMLRQQQQQYQNASARVRPRTTSAFGPSSFARPDDSDYAIDEVDETYDGVDPAKKTPMGRRLSEYTLPTTYSRSGFPLDRKADINKNRAYWQSAPGFGDLAQSRRHSFADIPTRQASITSLNEATGNAPTAQHAIAMDQSNMSEVKPMGDFGGYGYDAASAGMLKSIDNRISQSHMSAPQAPRVGVSPVYYGGNPGFVPSPQQQQLSQGVFPNQFAAFQQMHGQFSGRTTSPHHNGYPISQPRHNQLLHVVLFKCARADVFYIQEGTGLEVKPGDLVIVEADRGTDLGTVAKVNVDWQAAKELKEHYAEEHYKWLMMYSQNAKSGQDGPTGVGALGMPGNGLMQPGTVGGMGPPGPHMQEPVSSELKPKLIKRLAQAHEVTSLREKEGNEAKAKRVCMQKVKEHGLNMEILDAEFQMDWKKLTFYYFADNYINFNSLVTDLFKIYKTRIWMSAINPASFASPTLGLQAPSGIGPGAVGVSRNAVSTERRQSQASHSGQPPYQFQQQQPQHIGHIQQQTQHLMQQQRHMQPQQQNFGGIQGYTNSAVNPGVNMSIQGFNGYGNIPNVSHSPYNAMNPHGPPAVGNWNQEGQAGIQQAGNGSQQDNGDWIQQMQSLSLNPQ